MIELFHNPHYDFIGKRRWAYLVSIVFTLIGLVSLGVKGGLRYDIGFSGGETDHAPFLCCDVVGRHAPEPPGS